MESGGWSDGKGRPRQHAVRAVMIYANLVSTRALLWLVRFVGHSGANGRERGWCLVCGHLLCLDRVSAGTDWHAPS